jgi:putative transposase
MSTEDKQDKNSKIAKSLAETRQRRKSQTCHVYTMKIDMDQLSPDQLTAIKMQFVEAKWLTNEAIASGDVFKFVPKKTVIHKNRDMVDVESEFKYLGSQQKQSIIADLQSSIKTLSTLKKKGKRIGKLKYRKEITAINLKQFGVTYKIKDRSHISIQNIPSNIRVHGLHQIFSNRGNLKFDVANAKLIKKPNAYYLAITCYKQKENKSKKTGEIGIDMGISTAVTLSDGRKFNASVQETDRLKRLQRKFARQVKGSKRRYKTLLLIKREYQKISNRKTDIANKICAEILKFEHIYMQDENLSGWKNLFGKQVQHSVLGRVKAILKRNKNTHVLSRWEPTSKLCTECGTIHALKLSDRQFVCDCGVDMDRDVHAACNMIAIYKLKIGTGHAESTFVETK